jgi:hypothetical protein
MRDLRCKVLRFPSSDMGSPAFRSEFDGIARFLNHYDAKGMDLELAPIGG